MDSIPFCRCSATSPKDNMNRKNLDSIKKGLTEKPLRLIDGLPLSVVNLAQSMKSDPLERVYVREPGVRDYRNHFEHNTSGIIVTHSTSDQPCVTISMISSGIWRASFGEILSNRTGLNRLRTITSIPRSPLGILSNVARMKRMFLESDKNLRYVSISWTMGLMKTFGGSTLDRCLGLIKKVET